MYVLERALIKQLGHNVYTCSKCGKKGAGESYILEYKVSCELVSSDFHTTNQTNNPKYMPLGWSHHGNGIYKCGDCNLDGLSNS
jgi:ribosomal protein L37AE/L43A